MPDQTIETRPPISDVYRERLSYFVGRKSQRAAFDAMWTQNEAWLMAYLGASGHGKSVLLNYLAEFHCKPQKIPFVLIDLHSPILHGDPFALAARLGAELRPFLKDKNWRAFEKQRRAVQSDLANRRAQITQNIHAEGSGRIENVAQNARVMLEIEDVAYHRLADVLLECAADLPDERMVFFFDTYEMMQRSGNAALSGWLWDRVFENLWLDKPEIRVVLASQDALESDALKTITPAAVPGFLPEETRALLQKHRVEEQKLTDAIQRFTGGHPLLVEMAGQEAQAGRLQAHEIEKAILAKKEADEWLFAHVMERLPKALQQAAQWAALLRGFNHDSLSRLLEPFEIKLDEPQFRRLERMSFVLRDAGRFRCHDLIRHMQHRRQSERRPETLRDFYQRAKAYAEERTRGENGQLDAMYYNFVLEEDQAHGVWQEAVDDAQGNWRRERWGQLIGVGKDAGPLLRRATHADIQHRRGKYLYYQNRWNASLEAHNAALALFRAVGDRLGEANTLQAMGDVYRFQDKYDEALKTYDAALALFRAVGDRLGEANLNQSLARLCQHKGDHAAAKTHFQNALAGHAAIGSAYSIANDLYYFSYFFTETGAQENAVAALEMTLKIWSQLQTPYVQMAVEQLSALHEFPSESVAQAYFEELEKRWQSEEFDPGKFLARVAQW